MESITSQKLCTASIEPAIGLQRAGTKRGLGPRHALYVDSPVFARAAYGAQHPLAIARTETVTKVCRALDWLPDDAIATCAPASVQTLARFHDAHYVAALHDADRAGLVVRDTRRRYDIGTMENPLFSGVFERAATAVGGSILAAELALDERVVFHPAGGTHHGKPGRASGFCYFNDPVFALLTLFDAGLDRIVYADLDAHHGDGVEAAFQSDPRVRLVSIHEAHRWPHTGAVNPNERICNLPVAAGCDDRTFTSLIKGTVLPFVACFDPQAIVITCGADSLAGDPLSTMRLSNNALWQAVDELAQQSNRVIVLGGGGYNPWLLARCWSGLWARLADFEVPAELPQHARRILESLDCDLIDDDVIEPGWISRLADWPE